MPKTRRPIDPRLRNQIAEINFYGQPVVEKFVQAIGYGTDAKGGNEIACYGSRGDGKTIGWMVGAIEHSRNHFKFGYPLPVSWMGVTDTFTSHKLKTVRSMENPMFKGGWRLTDNDHVARFYLDGACLVHVDLFGIEDQGAKDRLRMECVGMWFEEPAPSAVMVQSTGIDEDSWRLGRTSQRVPSHFHPAVTTLNLPDEDHWTWRRWKPTDTPVFSNPENLREIFQLVGLDPPKELDRYPQGTPIDQCYGGDGDRRWFRVPVGERASHADRLSWASALKERTDLLRRLILGLPGVVMLGSQVAKGFNRDDHTTQATIPFVPGEPVYFGLDFGHTPTCIIGQAVYSRGYRVLAIKAALYMQGAGMRQLFEELVLPWLSRFAPWVLRDTDTFAVIGYDPSQGTVEKPKGEEADIDNAALTTIREMLDGGDYEPGPVSWENRRELLRSVFPRRNGVMIEENEFTLDLIRALDGRWYYPQSIQGGLSSDKPKKPNHPWEDLGDAFCYLLSRYGVLTGNENRSDNIQVQSNRSG